MKYIKFATGNCSGYTAPTGYQLCKLLNSKIENGIAKGIIEDCLSVRLVIMKQCHLS